MAECLRPAGVQPEHGCEWFSADPRLLCIRTVLQHSKLEARSRRRAPAVCRDPQPEAHTCGARCGQEGGREPGQRIRIRAPGQRPAASDTLNDVPPVEAVRVFEAAAVLRPDQCANCNLWPQPTSSHGVAATCWRRSRLTVAVGGTRPDLEILNLLNACAVRRAAHTRSPVPSCEPRPRPPRAERALCAVSRSPALFCVSKCKLNDVLSNLGIGTGLCTAAQ